MSRQKRKTMPSKALLRMDSLTFAFLGLLALAFFDCLARFLSYCVFGDVLSNLACFIAGFCALAAAIFLLRVRIAIYAPAFNKTDIAFGIIFALYFFMKAIIPDIMADTVNYEIFVQEFAFTPKLEAMKPDLPSFAAWYSLGERVFYYFRMMLGFRLSILPNMLVVFVSYYKTKEILLGFFKEIFHAGQTELRSKMAALLSGAAFLILFDEFIAMGAVIIKPDLFVLPLLLECFRAAFQSDRRDASAYALCGLLTGLSVAVKLTNAVYFLPMIAYIVYSDARGKTFAPKKLFFGALGAMIPVAPFALYSLIFTGSPVYPFFNAVFRSPYYPLGNTRDMRWGPQSLPEILAWPFIVVFDTSRFGEIISGVAFSNGRLAMGYIVSAVSLFAYRKSGLLAKRLPMALCILAATVLWSASTGYVRYGMVIGVLVFIYLAVFMMDMLALGKRAWAAVFTSLAAASIAVSLLFITFYNFDWSWRPTIFQPPDYSGWPVKPRYELNIPLYREYARLNLPHVLNDYTATEQPILQMRFDSVQTWICLERMTADAVLANPNADFFILSTYYSELEAQAEKVKRYFSANSTEGLFALERVLGLNQAKLDLYSQMGFKFIDIEEIALNSIDASQTALFITLAYNNAE